MKTKRQKSTQKSEKKLFEKWQSWVAIISTIIVLTGLLLDLPERIIHVYQTIFPAPDFCEFYGQVVDANHNPVIGAEVKVVGKGVSGTTDDNGEFNFEVQEKSGTMVLIQIKTDGKIRSDTHETLPGPSFIALRD